LTDPTLFPAVSCDGDSPCRWRY